MVWNGSIQKLFNKINSFIDSRNRLHNATNKTGKGGN